MMRAKGRPARFLALPMLCLGIAGAALPDDDMRQVAEQARTEIAAESPATVFPFRVHQQPAPGKIVIAHYFPVFPLSIDNQPTAQDYYAVNYLRAEGEQGKFRAQRGFLRQRPLPVPVGSANGYVVANLAREVARAARIGIDAFGIDLLSVAADSALWQNSLLMLDVAQMVAPGFRIVPEPDMGSLGPITLDALVSALDKFATHPASYRLADGRMLVMPMAAELRDARFWGALQARMAASGHPIALVPDYVDAAPMVANAAVSWGATVWGDRDPAGAAVGLKQAARARKAGIAHWFMPVAPQDARPKDYLFIEARNSEAFRVQWEAAITSRSTGVHLLTWNDYSEATEISPSSFSQFLFYDLAAYYIAWFKAGAPPLVTADALYYVQRNQIFDPNKADRGRGSILRGGTPMANDVELVALLKQPGRLIVDMNGRRHVKDVPAGLQTLRAPTGVGTPVFSLVRGGRLVLRKVSDWPIRAKPDRHDATYGGGSSTRPIHGR